MILVPPSLQFRKKMFSNIKRNVRIGQKLSELLITGITISAAVQGRGRKVTTQALISFTVSYGVAKYMTNRIFLVVPHLTPSIILGDDWLNRNRVRLDCTERKTYFPLWNIFIPFFVTNQEQTVPINTCFTMSTSPLDYPLSINDQCLSNIKTANQHLHGDVLSPVTISSMNTKADNDLEPFEYIKKHVL